MPMIESEISKGSFCFLKGCEGLSPAGRCGETKALAKPFLCYKQLKMKEIFLRNLTIFILDEFSLTRIQEEAKFSPWKQKIELRFF